MSGREVEAHYTRQGDLLARIRAALAEAGLDEQALTTAKLAPLDHFHVRGRAASLDLVEALALQPGERVLDIGGGIGGPARLVAEQTGAEVVGVDLTRDYVEAANWLSEKTGLAGKVRFQQADALALPFADASFDAAYSQHVAMNVADKAGFYAEAARVLKPGGRFFCYDVMAGDGQPLAYPTPWAADETTSFLATPEQTRAHLEAAGFEVIGERDVSAEAKAWYEDTRVKAVQQMEQGKAPALGLHLLLGDLFRQAGRNQFANLSEGRVRLVEMTAVR